MVIIVLGYWVVLNEEIYVKMSKKFSRESVLNIFYCYYYY